MTKSVIVLFVYFISGLFLFCIHGTTKTISGQILKTDNTPAEYITVTLAANDTVLQSTQTDSLGRYSLNFIPQQSNKYNLKCSVWDTSLYEETITSFDEPLLTKNIVFEGTAGIGLDEVVVQGAKSTFSIKNDRYVFSPGADLLVSNTCFDVLKQMPMIKADDDKIALLFKSGTVIYVNNKPLRMPVASLITYLKSMPSDNIKNIEIITNPGSKYEASTTGGIININLRKNIDDGFQGQAVATVAQAKENRIEGMFNVQYRKDKLGLSGGVYAYNNSYITDEETNIVLMDNHYQDAASEFDRKYRGIILNLNAEYAINESHIINLSSSIEQERPIYTIEGYTTYGNNYSSNQADSLVYTENNSSNNKTNNYFFNAGYQYRIDDKGQELNICVDYMNYLDQQIQCISTQSTINNETWTILNQYSLSVPQKINTYSLKSDYTLPFGDNKIEAGAFYSHNKSKNDYTWSDRTGSQYILNPTRSNLFLYTEAIAAIYASYSRQWAEKVTLNTGLRVEYTAIETDLSGGQTSKQKNNYTRLFPSLSLNYVPESNWKFNYSLSSKLIRPAFWELSPMRFYFSDNMYSVGNPSLKSAQILEQEASISYKDTYFFNMDYGHIKDDFRQILLPNPAEKDAYYYGRFNYGNRDFFSITLMILFNFFDGFWKGYTTAGMQYDAYDFKDSEIAKYYEYQDGWNGIFRLNNTLNLSKKHNLWGYVNAYYYSPKKDLNQRVISYPNINIEVKKIWDRWTVSLLANDITNGNGRINAKAIQSSLSPYKQLTSTCNANDRSIRIKIAYQFGNKQIKGNKEARLAGEETRGRVK